MEKRYQLVLLAKAGEISIAELCEKFEVPEPLIPFPLIAICILRQVILTEIPHRSDPVGRRSLQ